MTTSFFFANTQYNPIHDVDTVSRPVAPAAATAPLRRAPSTSKAGWAVSGIAALVGLATFSTVSVYAFDEFTRSPAPLSTSTPAPAADYAVPPPAPVAPPAPPSAPEVKEPVEAPRVVVVPSYRRAPAPAKTPDRPLRRHRSPHQPRLSRRPRRGRRPIGTRHRTGTRRRTAASSVATPFRRSRQDPPSATPE